MDIGKIEQLTTTTEMERLMERAVTLHYDGTVLYKGRLVPLAAEIDAGLYEHKFDALIAAVMELDDATRDRILARAKALEAES